MSAPDIGALAESVARFDVASSAARDAMAEVFRRAEDVLAAAFGGSGADGEGQGWRWWRADTATLLLEVDPRCGTWSAKTGVQIPAKRPASYSMDPASAVAEELDALAKTHPTEAELLRKAVTFKEPTP